MAEEARNCFASLLETGQRLLGELDLILQASHAQHTHNSSSEPPAIDGRQPSANARKSSSRPSHRCTTSAIQSTSRCEDSGDVFLESSVVPHEPSLDITPATSEPHVAEEDTPHPTDADARPSPQRKRKSMSTRSITGSSLSRRRSKHMVVVQYDGDIQKQFDSIVRTIGVSRNSMRKGKMSATIDSMSQSGTSSGGGEGHADDALPLRALGCYSEVRSATRSSHNDDETQAFDRADAFLDKAQTLCEHAAHQVLRDGDCSSEIENAKTNMLEAVAIAEAEIPALTKRAEQAAERRKNSATEEERASPDDKTAPSSSGDSKLTPDPHPRSPGYLELEVDEHEVDEFDEADDPTFAILDTLRLGKLQMRTTAAMARGAQAV